MLQTATPAWLWGDTVFTDVRLKLCTTQLAVEQPDELDAGASDSGRGRAKAARIQEGSSTAPEAATQAVQIAVDAHSATFHLHSTILAGASPYFRTRMTGGTSRGGSEAALAYANADAAAAAADGSGDGGLPACRWVLVEHVEEAELDAMEALLRHCYTGGTCEAGGNAAMLSVAKLLQMMVLADRFDVPLCTAHCCDQLLSRCPSEYDIIAVNQVFQHTSLSRLCDVATQHMLQLLGDADAVCGAWYDADSSLDAQLLQLSLPALLALLSSDSLKARSENAVLLMADGWASGPHGAACTAAQLRQLAEVLRLGQLTHTFTFDILQSLPWLQLSSGERDSLLFFCSLGRGPGGAKRQAELVERKQVVGPPCWFDGRPRAGWTGAAGPTSVWHLPRDQLALLLKTADPTHARLHGAPHFVNGFTASLSLLIYDKAEAAKEDSVGAWVGLRLKVLLRGDADQEVTCRSIASAATVELARGDVSEVAARECSLQSSTWMGFVKASQLSAPLLLDIKGWQPYLVAGQHIHMECHITSCA